MRFLEDDYVRYYLRNILIGLVIVGVVGIVFYFKFQPKYDIKLSSNVFSYGSSQTIVDRVETIGNVTVKNKNRISSNTIKMDGYEVTFDSLDTYKVGKEKITAKFSDSSIENQTLIVSIVDKKAPKITFTQDEPLEMELKDVEKDDWDTFYLVEDNETNADDIKTSAKIKEKQYKEGSTVHLVVTAKDTSGNKTKKSFIIHIKEKEVKEEKKDDGSSSSEDESNKIEVSEKATTSTSNDSSSTSNQSTYEARPSNRTFLFSDGYDIESAPSACEATLNSSSYGGRCTPLQDSEGIYYGMQLIWD